MMGLKLVYEQYVRSILEYAMVSVYPMLNASQMSVLESVQRSATSRTILSIEFTPDRPKYDERLQELSMEPLSFRWAELFTKFARKMEGDPRFARFLFSNPSSHAMSTRMGMPYHIRKARTERFKKSPVNSI